MSDMTELEIEGSWNLITDKQRQKWVKLPDDDLQFVAGPQDELFDRFPIRTDETRGAVEDADERIGGHLSRPVDLPARPAAEVGSSPGRSTWGARATQRAATNSTSQGP